MNQQLSFKQFRGQRFFSEIFKIIALYIHYAEKKNSGYVLNMDGLAKIIRIEEHTLVFGRPYFFKKLGVNILEDLNPKILVDLDTVCAKFQRARDKTEFFAVKKLCMQYHEEWYPN